MSTPSSFARSRILQERLTSSRVFALTVLLALPPTAVRAQDAAAPQRTVTRADLAAAYMRLDRVISPKMLDDSARAAVSRAFDRSTLSFFGGRFLAAITTIDSLTTSLSGSPIAPTPAAPSRLIKGMAPSAIRDLYLARLAKFDSTGVLAQPLVSARSRASLLVDVPSTDRSAEFLFDPATLAAAVEKEVAALERGRNPYAKFSGDIWRSFKGASGTIIPYRLVAAGAVAASSKPVPVLFVLHGAGGDENMFVDAYGAGVTPAMAKSNGMLLVSPATTPFSAAPESFDLLLVQLRTEYNIDTARVYVMGHSMGAGATAKLASQRPKAIAAAVCLAGGSPVKAEGAPPMFFVGAQLDPIIPARNVKTAADATPGSLYKELPNEGHTLMVANGVRMAIPWLLERHR